MIITGSAKLMILSVIIKFPNKAGIPITANVLKIFEPRIFPTAISDLPFFAALTLTANSGNDVPSATAPTAIISVPIFKISEIFSKDSIV